MIRIGDFSRLARVSARLLRYYDELGLLCPVHVDDETGYRYYSASQLPRLNRILALKDLGLSLEQIDRMLKDDVSPGEIRRLLLDRRAAVERQLTEEAARLARIDARLRAAQSDSGLDEADVVVKSIPARTAVSVRQTLADFTEGRARIAELLELIPLSVDERMLQELFGVVHSPNFEPQEIDAQLGFFVERKIDAAIPLPGGRLAVASELPSVEMMATVVRIGPPEHAHLATGPLCLWLEANGYRLAGPNREVFVDRPRPDGLMQAVVEMQFPIELAVRSPGM